MEKNDNCVCDKMSEMTKLGAVCYLKFLRLTNLKQLPDADIFY